MSLLYGSVAVIVPPLVMFRPVIRSAREEEQTFTPLKAGDKAPDFDLPAAHRDGRIALADVRRRGPVLLTMLRGLYCPFCRRHIAQLKPTCDMLQEAHIELLGLVIGAPERTRRYFEFVRTPCFPIAAAPDRALHR